MKPAIENSLRILTSVIDGMRHWSQFKDKVPYMFEIFGQLIRLLQSLMCTVYECLNTIKQAVLFLPSATLDSAVTLGHLGAKNFLMRDGKEVVTCVFYENVSWETSFLFRSKWNECVKVHLLTLTCPKSPQQS